MDPSKNFTQIFDCLYLPQINQVSPFKLASSEAGFQALTWYFLHARHHPKIEHILKNEL